MEVVRGDLKIGEVSTEVNDDGKSSLLLKITGFSSEPGTIKISNIKVTVSRAVPSGPVYAEISGTAISENNDLFPGAVNPEIHIADVVSESPSVLPVFSVFNVDSSTYLKDGSPHYMDVKPYVERGRLFVPLRYLANALGVDDDSISYEDNRIILEKDLAVIELEVGSKTIIVNGKEDVMDVPPAVLNGRVMLPARHIVEALGGEITYDTGSVMVNASQGSQ